MALRVCHFVLELVQPFLPGMQVSKDGVHLLVHGAGAVQSGLLAEIADAHGLGCGHTSGGGRLEASDDAQ